MLCLNLIDNIAALFRRLFYTMKSMHMVMYTRVMCMYIELYALDNLLMDILVLRMAAALVGRPCSLRRSSKLKMEVSLDEPLNIDWDGNELLLSDILGTDNDLVCRDIEDEVDKELLNIAMNRLNPREKRIMELRFGLGGRSELTQKQVADMMGISQSYISRLEKHILKTLKREMQQMSGI